MSTYLLIGMNVLVSLIGFSRMNSGAGERMFVFSPSEVFAGRNYQGMLLSHFAHADGTHLLFNMLTLYSFGPVVELGLGAPSMLLIYVSAWASSLHCSSIICIALIRDIGLSEPAIR